MTPEEFVSGLLVHYAKRHQTDAAEAIWLKDMLAVVRKTDRRVLARAYELIRDEHDERAFPLPATILRFVTRACDQVYPESRNHAPAEPYVQHSAESRSRVRDLLEQFRRDLAQKKIPHAPVDYHQSAANVDVTRPAFEEMQRRSRTGLMVDHSALARRITGEQADD